MQIINKNIPIRLQKTVYFREIDKFRSFNGAHKKKLVKKKHTHIYHYAKNQMHLWKCFWKKLHKKPIFCDFCNFRRAQDFLVPQHMRQIIKHISFYYYAKNLMKRFWKNCKKPYFWEILSVFGHANMARLLFWCHNKCTESKSTYTSHKAKNQIHLWKCFGKN